jgi:predicted XRE-type DNA-binding protein
MDSARQKITEGIRRRAALQERLVAAQRARWMSQAEVAEAVGVT